VKAVSQARDPVALAHHQPQQHALADELGETPPGDQGELGTEVAERRELDPVIEGLDLVDPLLEGHLEQGLLAGEVLVQGARAGGEPRGPLDLAD
jgi:hypothetical protein